MSQPRVAGSLVARIHAIVRRAKGHAQSVITIDDLCLNLDAKTVEVNGARFHLTSKGYQMLELLALRKDTTLTKGNVLAPPLWRHGRARDEDH
jgi:two-component system, cell cycle response regulator CtrA